MKSSFTAEEIADAFRYYDVDMYVAMDDEHDGEVLFIEGTVDDLTFEVTPFGPGPFFEEIQMEAIAHTVENPIEWATEWNGSFHWTTAVPLLEDDGSPYTGDGGDFAVNIQRRLGFYGGIHPDTLKVAAGQFLLEFLEMYGIEESEEIEDDEEIDVDAPIPDRSKTRDAIAELLKDEGGQSAKQLSVALNEPKNVVNSILYGCPDLFRRQHATPPLWFPAGA
jgi:hypothetical protein